MNKSSTAVAVLTACSLLAACGGRPANPVMVTQFGDTKKSCTTLLYEMDATRSEMQRLLPETDKTGQNVALGITGAFFLVPLFFMDFSAAEEQEYNALRQRYNYLATVAMEKGCDENIPLAPSAQELEADAQQARKIQPAPRTRAP